MKSLPLLLWTALVWAGTPGEPERPVAEASGDLDGDGRPERVYFLRDGSLHVDDAAGHELGRLVLAPADKAVVALLTAEEQPLVRAKVGLAKGRAAEAVLRVVKGKLETIYAGTTGPVGDGERADRLRVDENGVVRYQTSPTVQRCDGEDMLFPERWDFAGHRFRPVEAEAPSGPRIAAVEAEPGHLPESLRGLRSTPLGMFHFTAASTSPDAERRADRLGAPRELEDSQANTAWVAGPSRGGRGAWVTARAPSGDRRLKAVRLVPGPGWPKELAILVGNQTFRVALSGPGPVFVKLPELPSTSCVSLVVAEPHGEKGPDTSLVDAKFFTDIDFGDGLGQLVEAVAADQAGAAGAEQVLSRLGPEAARAIEERLKRSQAGRRRLLSTLASLKVPEAAPPLAKALETAAENERPIVVDGLTHLGAAGAAAARRVYEDASQAESARQDAAQVLGRAGGEAEVLALIQHAGDAPLQVATLRALQTAMSRDEKAGAAVKAALEADTTCGPQVGVLARLQPGPAVDAAWRRCGTKGDFTLKLRLVRSLKDPALLAEAEADPDPVVRAAAVENGGPLLLQDADPGVRRVSLLRAESGPAEAALRRDAWPMVRRAAAEALGRHCVSAPALSEAVEGDASEEVRRESLVSLGRCGAVPLAFLSKVLKSSSQPMAVRELAAALAAKQGGAEAARLLAESVEDVLTDPAADERSASLAIACLRGLGRLKDGSRRVLEALGAASNEPMSGAVRAAAMEAIGQICPEGAGEALRRGLKDPDAMTQRAARQALDKCKR
jgi:HEAT repeat protein